MWKLVYLFALSIIQPLLESIHYNPIDSLSLSIPLGVSWSGIPICDTQFTTVPSKSLAIKLKSVVRDEGMRDPKPSDNVLPHKPFSIHIPNVCQWLNFNSLGKVISVSQKPSPIFYCFGEGPHNVQAPLRKRLWTKQRIKKAP